jgi:hypothetical protein
MFARLSTVVLYVLLVSTAIAAEVSLIDLRQNLIMLTS